MRSSKVRASLERAVAPCAGILGILTIFWHRPDRGSDRLGPTSQRPQSGTDRGRRAANLGAAQVPSPNRSPVMNSLSTSSTGKGSTGDTDKDSTGSRSCTRCGCDIDIHIDSRGDVNIYNCSTPSGTGTSPPPPPPRPNCELCFPPYGACLPVVPGKAQAQPRIQADSAGRSSTRSERARGRHHAHGAPVSPWKSGCEPVRIGCLRNAEQNVAGHSVLYGHGLRYCATESG